MKFGINRTEITPRVDLVMDGFFDRLEPSEGTLDPLYATTYVLEHDKTKVALVCVDILGIDMTLLKQVQDLVSSQTDIPKEAIILNASHTHAAPSAARLGDMGSFFRENNPTEDDLLYHEELAHLIATSIIQANDSLIEGSVLFTQTSIEGVSSNRVHKDGPFNNIASIFQFVDLKEKLVGVLTLFANHPTILGPNNLQYSNDFIGYFNQAVEAKQPGVISGYLQGCAAEISSRFTKTTASVAETKRLGEQLAHQILNALSHSSRKLDDVLFVSTLPIHLFIREFEDEDFYKHQILEAEQTYRNLQETCDDAKLLRSGYVVLEGKKMIARMQKEIDIDHIDTTMSHIQIGNVHLITTPGETFGGIEKDIQALSRDTVLVLGYTNAYVAYLPDEDSYRDPNIYEVNMSPTSSASHQILVQTAKELLLKNN